MLRQLTIQDASFLYVETPETPEHVGGLSLVELPEGHEGSFYDDYRATIAARMAHVPFMSSRLVELPLDLDHPFWVDDRPVDLDYHVRHLTAPSPGTMVELEQLVGLLHGQPLDRGRPLWELYVIDGLESGHVAIYSKIHHAAMDGASSMLLINTIYDPTPTPRVFPPREPALDPPPSALDLAQGVLAHVVREEIRVAQMVPELIKAWNHLVLPNPRTLQWDPIAQTPSAPRTPFNVGITNQRAYAARSLPLGAVKRIARQAGVTVNDVVLTLCSGALRAYLQGKGALPDEPMSAMVPVSLHTPDNPLANHNSLFFCSLASDVADPRERLLAVHRSSLAQKRLFEGYRNVPLPDIHIAGAGLLLRRLVEWYGGSSLAEIPLWLGNLVISNVPGPQAPLYIAGARILTMYPCSIPFHGAALNITVQSYCDRLDFGLIACRRAVPDVATIADGLSRSLAELEESLAIAGAAVEAAQAGATIH